MPLSSEGGGEKKTKAKKRILKELEAKYVPWNSEKKQRKTGRRKQLLMVMPPLKVSDFLPGFKRTHLLRC